MTKNIRLYLLAFVACFTMSACGGDEPSPNGGNNNGNGGGGTTPTTGVNIIIDNTDPVSLKNRVIYEMNVGSFTSAGTFKAAQEKLSELKTLGVDIVWLMPIYPRGGGINSPYAATDFQATNPSYGTIADLKNLVARAHQLNMQVWLDWVPNHTATNARWVTEHPEYYKRQGGSMVNPMGWNDVYQLDYSNASLQAAMTGALKFWLDNADVDGFRCDFASSPEIPTQYWQDAIPEVRSHKSGKTIYFLAEADIVQDAKRLLAVGFDYDYAWNFQESQLAGFGPNGTSGENLRSRCENFVAASKNASVARMVYLTNHDVAYNDGGKTLISLYGANRHALTVLEFTLYGMPLLYNGQEIGCAQTLNYFTDEKINWNSIDAKMKNTVRTLVALRHTQAALADNVEPYFHTTDNAGVLAYTKTSGTSRVLVVMNLSAQAVNVKLNGVSAGNYVKWLDSQSISTNVATKVQSEAFSSTPSIALEAKGYAVYVKQ